MKVLWRGQLQQVGNRKKRGSQHFRTSSRFCPYLYYTSPYQNLVSPNFWIHQTINQTMLIPRKVTNHLKFKQRWAGLTYCPTPTNWYMALPPGKFKAIPNFCCLQPNQYTTFSRTIKTFPVKCFVYIDFQHSNLPLHNLSFRSGL